ncbi:hypothetical protein DL95DRAFT_380205 [Leptodontidium sp. 2 PMI_412]|nr:hypothetical protein DL95DRAFT_380205 [Leptodontidium sp. 2 PMI_412]
MPCAFTEPSQSKLGWPMTPQKSTGMFKPRQAPQNKSLAAGFPMSIASHIPYVYTVSISFQHDAPKVRTAPFSKSNHQIPEITSSPHHNHPPITPKSSSNHNSVPLLTPTNSNFDQHAGSASQPTFHSPPRHDKKDDESKTDSHNEPSAIARMPSSSFCRSESRSWKRNSRDSLTRSLPKLRSWGD